MSGQSVAFQRPETNRLGESVESLISCDQRHRLEWARAESGRRNEQFGREAAELAVSWPGRAAVSSGARNGT